jgi:transposase
MAVTARKVGAPGQGRGRRKEGCSVSMGTAGSVLRIAWVIHAGVDGATHGRSRPVPRIAAAAGGLTYLGLDVHRDTISVAVLSPRRDAAEVDRIANDEPSVRRLLAQFPDRRRLRACYEAGPTGYELARMLDQVGGSLPGDRADADPQGAWRQGPRPTTRLSSAGPAAPRRRAHPIRVPTVAEEAVRDLCRARADMVADRSRARLRLGGFLLRHGRSWRDGSTWTYAHERWLVGQRFDDPALSTTYAHYRATLSARDAALEAIEADLATWYDQPPFADAVARLSAYRGVTRLGALTLASEVADWRRFATAPQFMGFCGLVPSEYSSGSSTWRGRITKCGGGHLRTQLVESAWAYQHRPQATLELRRRQAGLPPEGACCRTVG